MTGRRRFIELSAGAMALMICDAACGVTEPSSKNEARLTATPATPGATLLTPGRHPLNLDSSDRDGFIYVPQAAANGASVPLLVLLHGASGAADNWTYLLPTIERYGIAVIAPDSRRNYWDYAYGAFGPDLHYIDVALKYAFDRIRINPARIAIGGFSDGATYALSLGLTNGDLFQNIMAFSPSVPVILERRGTPSIFIAHGTNDNVLPIEATRDVTVPTLRGYGYTVLFEQFEGGHTMPDAMATEAFNWWLDALPTA